VTVLRQHERTEDERPMQMSSKKGEDGPTPGAKGLPSALVKTGEKDSPLAWGGRRSMGSGPEKALLHNKTVSTRREGPMRGGLTKRP